MEADTVRFGIALRCGALDMHVCVPADWDDTAVKQFADRENPCGTEHGWQIRREGDRLLNGAPERVRCLRHQGRVHIVLDA